MSTITIDRAGRVVIPKPVRDRLLLEPGDSLQIEAGPDEITLRPVRPQATLIKKKGIWVHCAESSEPYSIPELIDKLRDERISELSR